MDSRSVPSARKTISFWSCKWGVPCSKLTGTVPKFRVPCRFFFACVNGVLNKQKDRPAEPTTLPPRFPRNEDVILVLPYLGFQSEAFTRRLKSCVSKFYGFVNLRVIFQNTCRVKSFFPCKDRFNRSQKSKIVYKATCWDCDAFYIGKTKRRLHDRKTEHFKALTNVGHASAVAYHAISTGHNIKWDHFEVLASGKSDLQCKIKETLT